MLEKLRQCDDRQDVRHEQERCGPVVQPVYDDRTDEGFIPTVGLLQLLQVGLGQCVSQHAEREVDGDGIEDGGDVAESEDKVAGQALLGRPRFGAFAVPLLFSCRTLGRAIDECCPERQWQVPPVEAQADPRLLTVTRNPIRKPAKDDSDDEPSQDLKAGAEEGFEFPEPVDQQQNGWCGRPSEQPDLQSTDDQGEDDLLEDSRVVLRGGVERFRWAVLLLAERLRRQELIKNPVRQGMVRTNERLVAARHRRAFLLMYSNGVRKLYNE